MKEKTKQNNYAYIDGANLHKGAEGLLWRLDYKKFRIWLKDKYSIEKAYLFLGLIPKYKNLYTFLQEAGFTLVFKETTYDTDGKAKGNCDADLVLKAIVDYYEKKTQNVVLVSSDGDYASLVAFFRDREALLAVVSPNNKCSFLLRKLNIPIVYLDSQKGKLSDSSIKEKAPDGDGTPLGSSSW
jgi:uncharacterized LabA/DUF88 family protein